MATDWLVLGAAMAGCVGLMALSFVATDYAHRALWAKLWRR